MHVEKKGKSVNELPSDFVYINCMGSKYQFW